MLDLTIDYEPHPNQAKIHHHLAKYRVAVCGRQFGKTTLAIMECVYVAVTQALARVWYVCPQYRQAEMVAWKKLVRAVPPQLIQRTNNMKLEIELINGSIIELKGAENEDALRGPSLDFVVLDEYAFMRPHIWPQIIQPMFAATSGRAIFIGTPNGKNHFHQIFNRGIETFVDHDPEYKSFRFKSLDSPFVSDKFVESKRKTMPDNMFRQEYEASFEDFTGLIYPEFSLATHVIEPRNIPSFFNRVHAIDPAISTGTTAAVFTAVDKLGNIIIYDEYYESDKMASDHAKEILTKYDKENDLVLIDPHASAKTIMREGQFFAPIDEYRACGINPKLGETHWEAGVNRVREQLKIQDKAHPFVAGLSKSPSLFIFNNCKNVIWEFERYRYADRPETRLGLMRPAAYKKNDHLMDCIRYICMSRPGKTVVEKVLKFGKKSLYAYQKRDELKTKGIKNFA